jgi:outer membrane protein
VTTLVLLAATLPAAALAQSPKIGYVDVPYLIDNSPQAREASTQLEEEFGAAQQQLQEKQQDYQRLQQKLQKDGLVMSESERQEIEQQMRDLKRDIQRDEETFREELNIQRNDAFKRVRNAVMQAVQNLAADEGYDLVVGQGALYASDAVDLTERVLERMKERYESEQSG